jgi:hypothetical protein
VARSQPLTNCLVRTRLVASALAATVLEVSSAHAAPPEPPAPPSEITVEGAAPPDAEPGSEGDLVETIDPDAPAPAPSPPPAGAAPAAAAALAPPPPPLIVDTPFGPAPAEPDRFELHGWARQSLEIGLSKRDPGSNDADPTALPYDQLTTKSQLFMRARYSHAHWFEADISGVVSYSVLEQAPERATTAFNGFNGESARGVLEPALNELYIGFFMPHLDIRIGQQRVAWGNTDLASPNDVVNARDLRDPFVGESELQHIPTFMLRADLDLGFATVQGIVQPVYTPDRYDVYGSNWAGIQPDAPAWMRGLANLARRSLDPTLQESAQRLFLATRYPKSDFTEPVLGARLSWSGSGVDVNTYYQYGFDGPLVQIDPTFAANFASLDFNHAGLADLDPWLAAVDAGQHPLQSTYVRRHHLGLDVATALGPFAFRFDFAYESKRVFFQRDLTGWVTPTVGGVLSAEYQTADKDKLALLELVYLSLIDAPPAPLLIYDRNTVAVGADVRWPLWRSLGFEVRGLAGINPQSYTVQPELNLKVDDWVLSGGALWLDGERYSLGQYFRRNVEGYAKLKLLF